MARSFYQVGKQAFGSLYGMGAKLSTTNGDTPTNGDITPRAVKRRRLTNDSPEADHGAIRHLVLHDELEDDFDKTLRIDLLSVIRKEDSTGHRPINWHYGQGSPEKKDIPVIVARCRVFVCEWRGPEFCRVLHSESQLCKFKVYRNSDDICRARIYLANGTFQIPAEALFVARDDKSWYLGDQYLIRVEIEYAGDLKWPPVDLLPRKHTHDMPFSDSHRWLLSAQLVYSFEKRRVTGPVVLRKNTKADVDTDLLLDMDLRWSTSSGAGTTKRGQDANTAVQHRVLAPLPNGHVNGRAEHFPHDWSKLNGNGHDLLEEDEDPDEATTPSRSLRTREKQNYNLKLLSDKARGRERKERKQRKLASIEKKGGTVTWFLPLVGKITVENFVCMRCYAPHSSVEQLMDHVKDHTDIKHSIDASRAYIHLAPLYEDPTCPLPTSLRASSPEDHDSDFEGDISPQRPTQKPPYPSRQLQPIVNKPRDNRQTIPNTKQPIFDRLSKTLLEPGSVVDPPPVNDAWLVQKHRDIIRDYTDVVNEEKEYIYEWDPFVNRECITSDPHLQDAYLRFVKGKASWIIASQNRMTEWSKHLTYLKARDGLTDATVAEALSIIRQAKSESNTEQPEVIKAPSPRSGYRKSETGCAVCGQPVRGAGSLICSNLDCDKPLYHKECARSEAKLPVDSRKWRCNGCNGES